MAIGAWSDDSQVSRAELIRQVAEAVLATTRPLPPADLAERYLEGVPVDDILAEGPAHMAAVIAAHWGDAQDRPAGRVIVRVDNDGPGDLDRTWLRLVTDDMPFLVDSVTAELDRRDLSVALLVHPVLPVRRDPQGHAVGLGSSDARPESFIHAELTPALDPTEAADLAAALEQVLGDVARVVHDWPAMLAAASAAAVGITTHSEAISAADAEEARSLLAWMANEHFTFLGYRRYRLERNDGATILARVPGTGLGILRDEPPDGDEVGDHDHNAGARTRGRVNEIVNSMFGGMAETLAADATDDRTEQSERLEDAGPANGFERLSPQARALALEPRLLVLTKANSRATVHRSGYLDYVGVKRFDRQGAVCGEDRFLGLYTSSAYYESPFDIPLLRQRANAVVARAGFDPSSHSGKDLRDIIETYPRDELFQMDSDELYQHAMAILALSERKRVRLLVRRDPYGRFVSCLLFVPRDRYTTSLRLTVTDLLVRAFGATGHEFQARVTEARLARLHFILHVPAEEPAQPDVEALERAIAATSRSWDEELRDRIIDEYGDTVGGPLAHRYAGAFGASYRDEHAPPTALADIALLEQLSATSPLAVRVHVADAGLELSVAHLGDALSLSDIVPALHQFGVEVLTEHAYPVERAGAPARWLGRFALRAPTIMSPGDRRESGDPGQPGEPAGPGYPGGTARQLERLADAVAATLRADNENDAFNGLVLAAGLEWRDVTVVRAYCRYLRQIGTHYSQEYLARALAAHPGLTAALVALFHARFDPARRRHALAETDRLGAEITGGLEQVASLDDDRILRSLFSVIRATVRTNAFSDTARPGERALAFKLAPGLIPEVPAPVPYREIWVASPRMEGVHLRMGPVARGGIRWSDRLEDFRTEVLGLVKAQSVKNAVIVPTGAKGGFVVKRPPPGASRADLGAEALACYRSFIGALLDVTDNLVDGRAVAPAGVVSYDEDDPYLVVAADKGTAAFSDVANEIALSRQFWLGDAFASGGSTGYDHKAMGITARGAWESVRAHLRQLSMDLESTDITVVGIGDMSGDVFGNGMLRSPRIRLVAAFDHRHIFLDPDPHTDSSFAGRTRLFELAGSTWDDYDRTLISPGGGVYPRSAKSIALSPQVRRRLGIEAAELTPAEMVSAILRAPVDLLWNGGIGTYIKASEETHADAGDKANDALRVDAGEVRARMVAEGGNLGLTQRARIELARHGVLVNTDAIDNSAGVDCSDHEVNIKILLDGVVHAGALERGERNELLTTMTDDVAALVLRNNYAQNRALANARAQAPALVDVHVRYLQALEQHGGLDRALESLPGDDVLVRRAQAGQGLSGPELAVLMAYTKNGLAQQLRAAGLGEDPDLASELTDYFPEVLRNRFLGAITTHPLAAEIVCTSLANSVVNYAGVSFAFRIGEETGADPAEVVQAHFVAWHAFEQSSLWRAVEELDGLVAADVQTEMYLESRKLVERAARWLLRHRPRPLHVRATLRALTPAIGECLELLPGLLRGTEAAWTRQAGAALRARGVPAALANRVALADAAFAALDITDVAARSGHPIADVATVHARLGDELRLDWLRDRVIEDLPRDDRWRSLARNALRDDLHAEHRSLVEHCLASAPPGFPADQMVRRWKDTHADALARLTSVTDELATLGVYDFATLSVALREVRDLAR